MSLDHRRSSRETRMRPWTDKPLKKKKLGMEMIGTKRSEVPFISLTDDYLIENTWIAERVDELRAIDNVKDFKPLTVILISSQLRYCTGEEVIDSLLDGSEFIKIVYHHHTSYRAILSVVNTELEHRGQGLKAERIIILCQGGPGQLCILENYPITVNKMQQSVELKKFWYELGAMMSKRDKSKTTLLIGGCDIMSSQSGRELLAEIKSAVKPSKLHVTCLPAPSTMTPSQAKLIRTFFIHEQEYKDLFSKRRVVTPTPTQLALVEKNENETEAHSETTEDDSSAIKD